MGVQVAAVLTVFGEIAVKGAVVQFDVLMFQQVAADLFGAVFLGNQFVNSLFDGSSQFGWLFVWGLGSKIIKKPDKLLGRVLNLT
ncbi:hypothetical protein GJU80_11580 [Neisseria brasiliensis]|uniref:Uncharacterized protein n=1 Tax=Neisseria brasiliensis TaxID=2666100 RepID=A0A7X2H009_9NEIS|nr:hypothetical protein [Neisseria brasiliensis]